MDYAPVSVIIPCYNGKDTIERAIKSVYDQTWRPAELIVVDDGSDKETVEFLRELKRKYGDWMKLIELGKNSGGPSIPRNVGWDNATQPYVAFLDHDDAWHPRKIEIQLNFMLQNPEIAMSGHRVMLQNSSLTSDILSDNFAFDIISGNLILFSNLIPSSSVILKRNLPCRFDGRFKFCDDYHLWIRLVKSRFKVVLINLILAFWFRPFYSPGGASSKLWAMEKEEISVYIDLGKQGYIPKLYLPFLIPFSFLKFLRRMIVSLRWR